MSQYIANGRAAGKSDSQITHELLDGGWQMDVIAKAMQEEPVKYRSLEPILDIKKQPYRKSLIIGILFLFIAALLAAFV